MITYHDVPEQIPTVVQAQAVSFEDWEDLQRDTLPEGTAPVVVWSAPKASRWPLAWQITKIALGALVLGWSTCQIIQSAWIAYDYHQMGASLLYVFLPWATLGLVWGLRFGRRGQP